MGDREALIGPLRELAVADELRAMALGRVFAEVEQERELGDRGGASRADLGDQDGSGCLGGEHREDELIWKPVVDRGLAWSCYNARIREGGAGAWQVELGSRSELSRDEKVEGVVARGVKWQRRGKEMSQRGMPDRLRLIEISAIERGSDAVGIGLHPVANMVARAVDVAPIESQEVDRMATALRAMHRSPRALWVPLI